ncbi:MAG TPA: hypothetical protein VF522_04655 [Ramlibacter sp.]|uniref:hypothetical protein n=1 Tax=Ramlibacter sp. TaxID=1917967 RepID=UPI002ED346FF
MVLVLGYMALTGITLDRHELLGARIGANKGEVVQQLSRHGVEEVLPKLSVSPIISARNIDRINALSDAPGICLNDYGTSASAKFNFDPAEGPIGLVHDSSVKMSEISTIRTRDELISKLTQLLTQNNALEAFACITGNGWVRIAADSRSPDTAALIKYDVWVVNIPNTYSTAELDFVEGKLKGIKHRVRLFEPF